MPTLLSATDCTIYFPAISATVGTITSRKLIETVETRLPLILNNYFVNEKVSIECGAVYNATARTITLDGNNWEEFGFKNGDKIFIYGSLRNDKYAEVSTFSGEIATLASAYSVVAEHYSNSSTTPALFSLVEWPEDVKQVAAEMVYFDADIRGKVAANIKSRSLGPLSESYTTGNEDMFGYPREITAKLDHYRIARLM
jgi:hypothetical protein